MVDMDLESSQRMAISGLVSGWMTVSHSGRQRRMTTISTAIMRRISKAAVRLRCGLRFHVRNDRLPMTSSAMMPIQRVAGVGLRWSKIG